MSSQIIDLADAVVSALNAAAFSETFTATRAYRPVFDLEDMSTLHVTVVPKGIGLASGGRNQLQSDVQIDIGIQKKLVTGTESEIVTELDGLMSLVEEIYEFIWTTRTFGVGSWVRTENDPVYAPEHLLELRQFTSLLTVTLRTMKT